jgi:hypothetical protein
MCRLFVPVIDIDIPAVNRPKHQIAMFVLEKIFSLGPESGVPGPLNISNDGQ